MIMSRSTDETGDVQPSRAELYGNWGISDDGNREKPSAPLISMLSNPGRWPAMGASPMRCSLSLLAAAMILAAPRRGSLSRRPTVWARP